MTSHPGCNRDGYADFPDRTDSGFMHKRIVTQGQVAAVEKADKEDTGESNSGAQGLVFLVGPRAANFSVERRVHSRAVLQKMSAAR